MTPEGVPEEGRRHAHPNSRTWKARRLTEASPPPRTRTGALPSLASRHEGFFVARHRPAPVRQPGETLTTLIFERRERR
ncbi:Type III restriction-modification system methylation subunit [Actinacidiphila cocklensis]|uniref:Type III restriction-modification system methylation subunit n=1 Tax=Actinacidiphila cocklensis TaxID=887465 RepID=A0A9W4DQN1_9ACTN|nr:Type III restriction-modification system methylation subunit [Actinacidiphila cocklensis]